jgi:hypothetical protein
MESPKRTCRLVADINPPLAPEPSLCHSEGMATFS